MALTSLTDRYSRTARLAPALLVAMPISLTAILSASAVSSWWGRVGSLLVASGMPTFATQIVRDLGRKVESELFASWGGPPTTALLRWGGSSSRPLVKRRHEQISRLLEISLPTERREKSDPDAADESYALAVAALRELTRDETKFPLVTKELTLYGFRRNLLGCRPLGMIVAGTASSVALVFATLHLRGTAPAVWGALAMGDLLYLMIWWRTVTQDWVKRAADRYALRLLESLERLANDSPKQHGTTT